MADKPRSRFWSHWYWLLIVQYVLALWVPFYNKPGPSWLGMPFFYWYQMALVLISAGLMAVVYFATERRR
jgi:hypothetical protein